jgi:hypothetical protein
MAAELVTTSMTLPRLHVANVHQVQSLIIAAVSWASEYLLAHCRQICLVETEPPDLHMVSPSFEAAPLFQPLRVDICSGPPLFK